MLASLLAWVVIVLGACWLVLKFFRRSSKRERDEEEREDSQNPYRK